MQRAIARLTPSRERLFGTRTTSTRGMKQRCLPCTYYRGGTSRALIFSHEDLPSDRSEWPAIFRRTLGSPDANGRQLDGMGGGISSLSKICIVGAAKNREVADLDYEFVAVGVLDGEVDFSSNCGNMSAAIGPYAWDKGLLENDGEDGSKTVKIWNVNSGKVIRSTFEVEEGEANIHGDFEMPGVTGGGSPIRLDFLNPAGSKTGKMFPTGNTIDIIESVPVSCVDVAIPSVFVKADDLSVDGAILPATFDNDEILRHKLESIRRKAAVLMGVAKTEDQVPGSAPKICLVSSPSTHSTLSGNEINEDEFDLLIRAVSVGQPHRAVPITVSLCLAATARVPGTVVHDCVAENMVDARGITIAHPSGKIVVEASIDANGTVESASVYRTARRLMEGNVYWKPEM